MASPHKPVLLTGTHTKVLDSAMKRGNWIVALLLAHTYSEAFLREWLLYSGNLPLETMARSIIRETERIRFEQLVLVHHLLGNIDGNLRERIYEVNKRRNEVAHRLIEYDLSDREIDTRFRGDAEKAAAVCSDVFAHFKQALDRQAEKV
ncbi:hypothetical protein J4439_01015 [Candidatus Woesearchaeota archaeon]|nr:hypothetical protein [Candidatus Woesearchaeota archaeon]